MKNKEKIKLINNKTKEEIELWVVDNEFLGINYYNKGIRFSTFIAELHFNTLKNLLIPTIKDDRTIEEGTGYSNGYDDDGNPIKYDVK